MMVNVIEYRFSQIESKKATLKNLFCKQVLLACRMKCSVAWCLRTARIQCISNCWSSLDVTKHEFMLISICKYLYWIEPPCSRLSPGQAWVQAKRLWRAILRRNYEMAINRFHIIRLFISKEIVVDRELKSCYKLKANVAKSSSLATSSPGLFP